MKRVTEGGEEEGKGVEIRGDIVKAHSKVDREWGSNGIG